MTNWPYIFKKHWIARNGGIQEYEKGKRLIYQWNLPPHVYEGAVEALVKWVRI